MMAECQIFIDASTYVANWLSKQPFVKEESLTDWLLFEISSKSPKVLYVPFSRHDEARTTGADWEWWFLFPHGSYRYRIQAKKASPNGDNYASIAYTNRYGLQIDKLISDAKKANAIPAYVFYSASGLPSNSKCGGGLSTIGAFSAGAQNLYQQFIAGGKAVVSESQIMQISIPLHCFACCPLSQPSLKNMDNFIQYYFSEERSALGENAPESRLGFHESLPSFVASLLNQTDEVSEGWRLEHKEQIEEFNAIVIHDLRPHT